MNVLIVGGGGREHALAWKLKQSPIITKIFIAPGNAGTESEGTNINAHTTAEIIDWLHENHVDLVVIGPDNYLADGLSDEITKIGITVFGPTKAAAEIEWSKSFAKQFMKEEGIPTAAYKVFHDVSQALAYAQNHTYPLVIKADGLAAGKGVVIARTLIEAEQTIKDMMEKKIHGKSGTKIVIEEFLEGLEISIHAFCDGERAIMFPPSKDHKRIFEGDKGPNTGGMGTIASVPLVAEADLKIIYNKIVLPTLNALKRRGRLFRGILFPGIMLTKNGPKVIEFNARFGDPETQSYMRILESDLFEILNACAAGSLQDIEVKWSQHFACCIVLASPGYPESSEKGIPINISESRDPIVYFHAATTLVDNTLVTNGGRVLGVSAIGETLEQALAKAYQVITPEVFKGVQYRKDIGASVSLPPAN